MTRADAPRARRGKVVVVGGMRFRLRYKPPESQVCGMHDEFKGDCPDY